MDDIKVIGAIKANSTVTIAIPAVPPSANRIWRAAHGHQFLSKEAREFNALTAATIGTSRVPDDWTFYRVEIVVHPTRRAGDVDNRIKPTLDALTKSGFWDDDKKVAFVSCRFGEVDKQGKTVVTVSDMKSKYGD